MSYDIGFSIKLVGLLLGLLATPHKAELDAVNQEIPLDIPLREKVWLILHDQKYPLFAKLVDKKTPHFWNLVQWYYTYCSCKCTQADPVVKQRYAETNLKLYGVANGGASEQGKRKYKETCLKLYGVDTVFKSDAIKEKIKKVNLKKYGVENPYQNTAIREKALDTLFKRYGVKHPVHLVPPFARSQGETEVYKFVKALCTDARGSDHKAIFPMSLDVFIPSLRLGLSTMGTIGTAYQRW